MPVDREQHIDEVMTGDTEAVEDYDRWLWEQERIRETNEIAQEDLQAAGEMFDGFFNFGPG